MAIIDLTIGAVVIGCTVAAMDFTTGQAPVWMSILSWLFSLVYLPFHAVLWAVLYANARVRNKDYAL